MKNKIYSKKFGSGPKKYVGISGWGGNNNTYTPIIKYLPKDVSFTSFDIQGFGKSEKPEKWDIKNICSEIIEELAINEKTNLVGNCTGGILGLEICKIMNYKINKLVMIDPFIYTPWYFLLLVNKYFGEKAYMATFASKTGRYISNLLLKSKRNEDTNLTEHFSNMDHNNSYNFLRMMHNHPGLSTYSNLTNPLSVIHGDKTFNAVKKSISKIKNEINHASIHEVNHAGHLPIEEQPDLVSKLIFNEYE
ncbi:MAG: alpha/beta fold hydrolase [Dehalococcoidia bacterium]